jgi:quercetin dioxygenase-like cupin family protein
MRRVYQSLGTKRRNVKKMISRTMYKRFGLLGCVLLAGLASTGLALAAGPPVVAAALGVGTLKTPVTIHANAGAMVVDVIRIAPGGDFGWHTHGSAVAVVITAGTLTVWDPTVAACAPQRYSKGAAFIEPAGHLHRARNNGTKPVTLYATYLGLHGARANIAGAAPVSCA